MLGQKKACIFAHEYASMMKRYFIELAYNGKNYHGWQMQPNASSVQDTIQQALKILLNQPVAITGCGRTDTGVHAHQFFAHFDFNLDESGYTCNQLAYKLNHLLDKDIAIIRIFEVNEQAHSRFDALSRTYKYRLRIDKWPFEQETTYLSSFPRLNFALMNEAASILFEYTDFSSFSKSGTDVKTNNCTIMYAQWKKENEIWVFTIKADRFLRNMVRAIVGTLLEVGSGKINLNDFRQIIESKNRSNAGWSVPAHGLSLFKLEYPQGLLPEIA